MESGDNEMKISKRQLQRLIESVLNEGNSFGVIFDQEAKFHNSGKRPLLEIDLDKPKVGGFNPFYSTVISGFPKGVKDGETYVSYIEEIDIKIKGYTSDLQRAGKKIKLIGHRPFAIEGPGGPNQNNATEDKDGFGYAQTFMTDKHVRADKEELILNSVFVQSTISDPRTGHYQGSQTANSITGTVEHVFFVEILDEDEKNILEAPPVQREQY